MRRCNEAYLAYSEWYKHLSAMRREEKLRQLYSGDEHFSSNILGRSAQVIALASL